MKVLYLDTNEINKYAKLDIEFTLELNKEILNKGYEVVISPITIFEILGNDDDLEREKLVYTIQNIGSVRLLPTIEEILVNQIAEESRNYDILNFVEREESLDRIYTVWEDVKGNLDKTFEHDSTIIEYSKNIKFINRIFQYLLSREESINDFVGYGMDIANLELLKTEILKKQKKKDEPKMNECIALFALIILVVGITPYPNVIDMMWDRLNIKLKDRYEFLINNAPSIFTEGPLVGIGALFKKQCMFTYSPGNLFDCYHIAYLPFVDLFITNDRKLYSICENYSHISLFDKVRLCNNGNFDEILTHLD